MKLKAQKSASLIVAAIGLALLSMMIIVEDEFGALPLLLLLGGLAWYARCRWRERSSGKA